MTMITARSFLVVAALVVGLRQPQTLDVKCQILTKVIQKAEAFNGNIEASLQGPSSSYAHHIIEPL